MIGLVHLSLRRPYTSAIRAILVLLLADVADGAPTPDRKVTARIARTSTTAHRTLFVELDVDTGATSVDCDWRSSEFA